MRVSTIIQIAEKKNVGDILEFGRYMVPSGMKPYRYDIKVYKSMEWYVLAKEGSRMLLLSRDCVDWEFIDGTGHPQTWKDCYVRNEVLPAFYKESFTAGEKSLIMPVRNQTRDNPVYGTKGGKDTNDRVFLLSIEEFQDYVFPEAAAAPLYQLEQADLFDPEKKNIYELCSVNTTWWLRSPGEEQYCNAVVDRFGRLDMEGLENGCDEVGIRPAIWIDLYDWSEDELPF